MNLGPLVEKLTAVGFNHWGTVVDSDPSALGSEPDPVRQADSAATTLAMISGYCDARRAGSNHETAMEHAHKRARAVRKALGYTHP